MKEKIKKILGLIVLSILFSLGTLHFGGGSKIAIEGLEFYVNTSLSYPGITQIEIPPLGLIRAHTHRTPIKITVRLDNINLERMQQLIESNPKQEEIYKQAESNLRQKAKIYLLELLLLAAAAGIIAAYVLHFHDFIYYFKSMLISMAVVSILLGATYKDYDYEQFSKPEFEGVLKAAPWMVGIAEEAVAKIDSLSNKMKLMAQNLNELYQQIDNLKPMHTEEGNIKVLHVSDIHNNPAAIEFTKRMAELFEVDFIIDTGDISDFGTPLEGLMLERIKELPVPYLFIAGNHDSPDTIEKMKELGGSVIVADKPLDLSGLKIIGFHDPVSQTQEITPLPPEATASHIDYIKDQLIKDVSDTESDFDIIAVHSPYIAAPLDGLAPVILFGHNHQPAVEQKKSVLVNAGTTGASGLGALQETKRRPYSVMLLHFYKDENETRLLAVDAIEVDSLTAEFNMQRHLFDSPADNNSDLNSTNKPLEIENAP